MAVSISAGTCDRVACNATAGNVTQISLGPNIGTLLVRPITSNGKITHTGTDGAAIGTDYATLDHSAWSPWPVAGMASVYIAHSDNNGVIEIWAVQGEGR